MTSNLETSPATTGSPDNALIQVRGVVKKYHDKTALHGVDLDVAAYETVALIGPSGCGKSTLCRTMVGLEALTAGEVTVAGYPYVTGNARKPDSISYGPKGRQIQLTMGMVFQDYSLFPQMTVLQNVALGPRKVLRRSAKDADDVARRVLARVGLDALADSYPEKLSGGQKQRVAIARELAMERQIIFLDEVTSALDPELVHEVLQVIRDLTDSGMTLVMVTHEMAFARNVADRIVFMDQGRIIETGSPAELFDSPREQRTRDFLDKVL
jgi:ABC-type polar amino acid transport system ATPase subunit